MTCFCRLVTRAQDKYCNKLYLHLPTKSEEATHEMLTPCEVAVKIALPSVRAMVANELMNKHNLNQAEAAKLLGISQPAVSLYQMGLRGNSMDLGDDPDITALVSKHADYLVNGSPTYKSMLLSFCGICKTIRSKGLLCKIHKDFDPTVDIENCDFCQTTDPFACP